MDLSVLAGPFGGAIAGAMFIAAGATWQFAKRTVFAVMEERIAELKEDMKREREECNRRLDEMGARVRHWEDLATGGMLRELKQLHDSGYRIIEAGKDEHYGT